MQCSHKNICSGCSWLDYSAQEQSALKIKALQNGLNEILQHELEITFIPVGPDRIRQRADLVIAQGQILGFYQKNKKDIFALNHCPLMSESLATYFAQIKKIKFPIQKGSLRIRAHAEHQGVWLDFANLDIKNLLQEKNTFLHLLEIGEVEIGQRRKKLSADLKLLDPHFLPWTNSWTNNLKKEISLYSCLGSFSQTGSIANYKIISELVRLLELTEANSWIEFGSGNGNLTLPLSTHRAEIKVTAVEYDRLATAGFSMTLNNNEELKGNIELLVGDFQNKRQIDFRSYDGVLVNPPRSGLGNFLKPLFSLELSNRPRDFIYMSCHLESFLKDICQLKDLGYQPQQISIVDQFPHSPHFEILSLFQLN